MGMRLQHTPTATLWVASLTYFNHTCQYQSVHVFMTTVIKLSFTTHVHSVFAIWMSLCEGVHKQVILLCHRLA